MATFWRSSDLFFERAPTAGRSDLLAGNSKDREAERKEQALWAQAFKRLVLWTVRRHRMNAADAEETVQEAVRQFFEAGGVVDANNPKALLDALGSRVNGIAVNRRRKKADGAVRLTAEGSAKELDAPSDSMPSSEARVVDGDLARRAISTLLERVDGDDLAQSIVLQEVEGVEDAADQARALARDVADVYKARKRLRTHVLAVKELMEKW